MQKRVQQLICTGLAIGLAGLIGFTPQMTSAATLTPTLSRLGGGDQYETAAKIAEQGWIGTSEAVVLSAGMTPNLVDALAAGPLAAKLKAPLILTDGGDQLNAWAKQELMRLKPAKVFITSGTAVIKPSVLAELEGMGITPVELGGYDQYETSVNIAKEMIQQGVQVSQVVVASGWTTPADALSIASIAAAQGMPILATTHDALPPSVKSFLDSLSGVTDSYVIGGTAVVGMTVQDQLAGTIQRYAGLTKYDTNIEVLKGFKAVIQQGKTYVANGETLVDALAGVPLAAQSSSAILLTDQTLPTASSDYALLNVPSEVVALGGQAVVPQNVMEQVSSTSSTLPETTLPEPTPPATTPSTGGSGSSGGSSGGGSTPISTTIEVQAIRVLTVPSYTTENVTNGATVDMSGAPETTQVMGFSIIVDKSCDLLLDGIDKTIPLSGGEATTVYLDDIFSGTHGGNGISLKTLRLLLGNSVIIKGELKKDGSVVGDLSLTLTLKI